MGASDGERRKDIDFNYFFFVSSVCAHIAKCSLC